MRGHDHLGASWSNRNHCHCHNLEQQQQVEHQLEEEQLQQHQHGGDTDRVAVVVQEVEGLQEGQVLGVRTALWWYNTAP